MARIRITQVRSSIGTTKHQKAILAALGLRKRLQTVEHDNSPEIMGMVVKMRHLITVEEVK
ncbi:LSU ribosomal protein L30P [Bacteroidales bacterium 6E]|nr:LSU ribosomal protein L30P [Bacteroidales bacterium 6E]